MTAEAHIEAARHDRDEALRKLYQRGKLRVKILDDGIEAPNYAHEGDAGLDLRSTVTIELAPNQRLLVPLGVAVEIPKGHVGLLFPRSGNAIKYGLSFANCVGVVDSGYRGEVCAELINWGDEPHTIERGERVAQLVIVPFAAQVLEVSDDLSDSDRGSGGFGSSGAK